VYVAFMVLHGLWVFSVVVRLVSGKGCVVWLKYLFMLKILNKVYLPEFVDGWRSPMVIVRFLKPNVVQLAMPESGVIVRKAHVSQLKPYYQKSVGGPHTDVK